MGIRGLETFVRDFVPNGFKEISIEDEIQKYRSEKKQTPILVIDLVPLIRLAFKDKRDVLYGGRWKLYSEIFEHVFAKLANAGADLVFFEDKLIDVDKYQTWISRQNQRYDEHIEVIDCINSGSPVDEIISMFDDKLNGFSSVIPIIESMARKHGVLKFAVDKDCDVQMASYASENNVLAILSDDTDFLIFKGDWKFWSINKLKVETMKTFELNRKGLRSTLRLNDDQLITLPTIAGNDTIRFDEIKEAIGIHFRFTPPLKFPNIARFIINDLPANEKMKAQKIALKMLGNSRVETVDRVVKSLHAYDFDFTTKEFPPLLQHCLDNDYIITFNILSRFPKNFTMIFYDFRKKDLPSYYDIVAPLFQRQLGILFYNRKSNDPEIKFPVYGRKSHSTSFEKFYVDPIYPELSVPPLLELLDKENSSHDYTRYALLKWQISSRFLKEIELSVLPDAYFLDVLTLVLMVDIDAITVEEADIFLYSFLAVQKQSVSKAIDRPSTIHERAFRLAFLFGKIREYVYVCLETVGLTKHATDNQFDGVFFHKSYLEHKAEGKSFEDHLEEVKEFRFYA